MDIIKQSLIHFHPKPHAIYWESIHWTTKTPSRETTGENIRATLTISCFGWRNQPNWWENCLRISDYSLLLSTSQRLMTRSWHGNTSFGIGPFGDHYSDVKMGTIASQITDVLIVYSTVCSDADQRKHQSSASLAFVRGIRRALTKGQ